jgi:hypothetical protein
MSTETSDFLSIRQTELFEINPRYHKSAVYFVSRLLGCWHLKLSRPVTRGQETYQSCLRCGMHRRFDPQRWSPSGQFYAAPVERSQQI